MAKNYQRHAQGRRFESKNFGDMGLRAYREQQQTIINAMKLQAAQYKDVHDEYLSGTIDKARKERENRAELKKLEDDVYDNKFLNTKIRADREIDQLRAQAEDHEKRAQFWQNFSSTYAKQYMQAFETVSSALDLKYAEKIHAQNKEIGDDGLSKYDRAIRQSEVLNNISSSGVVRQVDKYYTDPKNTGHYKRTQRAQADDIEKRRSTNYNDIVTNQLIEDSDKIITHLKDNLGRFDPKNPEKGVEITRKNIQGIIEQRALEIMANLGINPNSAGGKKFLDHMWNEAANEAFKLEKQNWAKQDEDTLYNANDGLLVGIKANKGNPIKLEIFMNRAVKLHQYRYVADDDGKVTLQEMNPKEAHLAVQDLLISEGIVTRSEMHLLNIPYTGQAIPAKVIVDPTKDTRKLIWDRHPDLRSSADASLLQKEKADQQNKNVKDKAEDGEALAKVQAQFENGKIDPSNSDQINALGQGYRDMKYVKTREFIDNARLFNITYNDANGFLINQSINEAYKNNDYKAYTNTMQYLGKKRRDQFNTFTKHMDEMNAHGASASQVKNRMEGYIKDDLEISDVSTRTHATAGPMAETMIQDFYYQYRIIANDKKYTSAEARVDAAYTKVFERYENGKGIYRKTTGKSGKQTEFAAMVGVPEPDTSLESKSRQEQYELIAKGWESIFTQAELDQTEVLEVLDQDYLDRNLRNVINGRSIEQNDMIDYLYLTQPQGAKMLTKTQIFNKYLEAKDISTRVPAGPLDKIERDLIKNAQINISNYKNMSDEDKTRMRVFLETGTMPTVKSKDVQSLEKNNEVRKNFNLGNLGGPQYDRSEVRNMNKSTKPWWYVPESLGRKLIGDHYYDKNK